MGDEQKLGCLGLLALLLVSACADADHQSQSSDHSSSAAHRDAHPRAQAQPTFTLQPVSEAQFKGQDDVPHCRLTDGAGRPIFVSAILKGGGRQAVIQIGDKPIFLSLGKQPNVFRSEDGSTTAVVEYRPNDVQNTGEDTVAFAGDLRVKSANESVVQRFEAICYATDFDEGWAGTSDAHPPNADSMVAVKQGLASAKAISVDQWLGVLGSGAPDDGRLSALSDDLLSRSIRADDPGEQVRLAAMSLAIDEDLYSATCTAELTPSCRKLRPPIQRLRELCRAGGVSEETMLANRQNLQRAESKLSPSS
jgi:hypothetical protein